MRILAFDQSTNMSGYAVLEDGAPATNGVLDFSGNKNTAARIRDMFLSLVALVDLWEPDLLAVEAVQNSGGEKTMLMLSQLQGMLIGYAYEHDIPVVSPMPVEWRKQLGFRQGPKVRREELKEQSIAFIHEYFDMDLPEDAAEAMCIAFATFKQQHYFEGENANV